METLTLAPHVLQQLEDKYRLAFLKTEEAVSKCPGQLKEIKKQVDHILTHPVDIGDYYHISCELAEMILGLGENTLFHPYFFENIHPNYNGRAKYFRSVCRDLKTQLIEFNDNRKNARGLRLVK